MSDTCCQTPGCGHAKSLHRMGVCVRVNPRCPCTRYTAPDGTLERGRQLATERDDLIAQGMDPADLAVPLAGILPEKSDGTETVSKPCACGHVDHTSGHFGWCMWPSCPCIQFRPGREQVLADAEAAWEAWFNSHDQRYRCNQDESSFIAGYLAAKGIDHE